MYCAVDVETTSLKGDVIQLAAVLIDNELRIVDTFNSFAKPLSELWWDKSSELVHGYSWEDAQSFQGSRSCVVDFMKFLNPHVHEFPLYMVYHALFGFDYVKIENFFRLEGLQFSFFKAFSSYKKISTIDMAKKFIKNMDNYKLNTLCDYLGIELNHHDAFSDAMACAKLFIKLKEMENDDGSLFRARKDVLQKPQFLPITQ